MEERTNYYLLKQKAVPEALLKVVEVKRLIETNKSLSIQEATDQVGISRSSFYKSTRTISSPFTTTPGGGPSPL